MIRLRAGTATGGRLRPAALRGAGRPDDRRHATSGSTGRSTVTVAAQDFLRWLDDGRVEPTRKDAHWLSGAAAAAGLAADRGGAGLSCARGGALGGACWRTSATSRSGQQALLDSIVLTAQSGGERVEVPLGPLSALTRMGFLPRGGEAAIDIAPGWIRVAAPRGSTFLSTGKDQLNLLGL